VTLSGGARVVSGKPGALGRSDHKPGEMARIGVPRLRRTHPHRPGRLLRAGLVRRADRAGLQVESNASVVKDQWHCQQATRNP
jgi:hypothetical protein